MAHTSSCPHPAAWTDPSAGSIIRFPPPPCPPFCVPTQAAELGRQLKASTRQFLKLLSRHTGLPATRRVLELLDSVPAWRAADVVAAALGTSTKVGWRAGGGGSVAGRSLLLLGGRRGRGEGFYHLAKTNVDAGKMCLRGSVDRRGDRSGAAPRRARGHAPDHVRDCLAWANSTCV